MSNNYQDFNSPNTAGLPGYESGMWLSPQQEAYTPVVSVWPQVTTQYQHLLVLGAQGISPPSTTPTAGPVVGGSKKRGAEEAGFQQTQPQTKLQRKRSTLDSLPRNFQPSGPLPGSTPPNAPLLALQQLPLPTLIYTAPTGAQYYMDIQTPLLTPSSTLLAPPQPGLEFNPGILPGQATVNPAAARAQFPVSYARPASPESGSNDQQDVVACQEHAGQISAQAYAQASLTAGPQQLYATTAHVFFGHTTMAVPQGELQAAALPPMERGGRKKKDGAPGETFTLITTTPPCRTLQASCWQEEGCSEEGWPSCWSRRCLSKCNLAPSCRHRFFRSTSHVRGGA
ncbi:unnamed protein product [Cyclocybe aegerita]|uniref:Uncharacterized protein n=1 Tax=Cyclocybe aegerita TaxID=1973307 RepID=A0A8S0WK75_CYCAE|nr:unnamed protein product [Cyclocybe aegerita]